MNIDFQRELVKRLSQGSHEAFTDLYCSYADMLYAYVNKIVCSPSQSEDIVQETFIRIWNKRTSLDSAQSFKSYLFQTSYHLVIDYFRSQVECVDFDLFVQSSFGRDYSYNDVEMKIDYDDFCLMLKESVNKLSKRQQEIFYLNKIEHWTIREIADKFGVAEKTIQNQLSIILSILKTEITLYGLFIVVFSNSPL